MKSPYLKTKLWNAIQKANVLYELDLGESLHNISVNVRKRGCSGHIINKRNGKCIYLTTEEACGARFANKSMIRYAKDAKDFSSIALGYVGRNVFVEDVMLPTQVILMLK